MAQLAVRQGVHLASLQQKDGRDLELVYASAALAFPADRLLDERSANEILKSFLAAGGAMLATDHDELRRWLVDTGFVRRSDYGTDYRPHNNTRYDPPPDNSTYPSANNHPGTAFLHADYGSALVYQCSVCNPDEKAIREYPFFYRLQQQIWFHEKWCFSHKKNIV